MNLLTDKTQSTEAKILALKKSPSKINILPKEAKKNVLGIY